MRSDLAYFNLEQKTLRPVWHEVFTDAVAPPVAGPMQGKMDQVVWLFTSVLLVELTSVARSTVRSGKQFWTGAFDLESAFHPRENWPLR